MHRVAMTPTLARSEDFAALANITGFQNLDFDVANSPGVHARNIGAIDVDRAGSDEGEGGDCEKPKRKRRSKQDRFPRNLAAIFKNVLIPEEVQLDSDAYREIGEEHHDEISCTRSELYWERTVREKFVRKEDRAQPPVIPPAPEPSVPGTMCAAALMARILCDKYLDHLPHYRQATRIERRYDAEISRQTLNKWTHAAADFLSPIADAILAEIQLGGCLAHIRRKFYEAREQVPEVVMPILQSIQRLYRIEENLRQSGAPPGCRELVRRSKSRPIVNELQKKITAELGVHLPKSNLGKALRYALGQWSGFARYMKDGRLEIDNNLVENAIRPTKLGAKNYLFFGSATAGINSATIYTLTANRKALGIDLAKNALGDQFQFRRRAVTVIFNVNVLRMPTAKSQRDVA